jgi:hypothetical protein
MAKANNPHTPQHGKQLGPKVLANDPSPLDEALYIPSVSPSYAIHVYEESYKRPMPSGLKVQDLNFLKPNNDLFRIGYVMSSAGQAFKQKKPCIITERDRASTSLICDSGGYAIAQQTAGLDGYRDRAAILGWMDDHADFGMTLDVPVGPVSTDKYPFKSIKACLDATLDHLRFFEHHHIPGRVCWLNVVQARTPTGGYQWYNSVKGFDFCDGWAIAGPQRKNFNYVLGLVLRMLEDGNLQQKRHIHVLGTSELPIAVLLTALQRQLNRNGCNLRITFDTASPFKMMANSNVYTLPNFTAATLQISQQAAPSTYNCVTSDRAWPWPSPVGQRLKLKDICVNDEGGSGYYRDDLSYDLIAHHNLTSICNAVALANRVMDAQRIDGVPKLALKLDRAIGAIEAVFKSGGSRDVLAAHSHVFTALSGIALDNTEEAHEGVEEHSPLFIMD